MSINLKILSMAFSLIIIAFILLSIRKDKINTKYSIVWLLLFTLLIISILIPGFLEWITDIIGFKTPSNLIFSIIIALLIIISIVLTIIVSSQDKKIRLLIQELSLLKEKYDRK